MDNYEIGIVGGSGFIGSSLAMYLSDSFKIKVLDKRPVPDDLRNRVSFQRCDIRNYNEVREKIGNVDLVIFAAVVQIPSINKEKRKGYEVNVLGVQNVCKVVNESKSIRGFIVTGSWHVFGERELNGTIDEAFGFRPDTIENRAKYYALTKMAQETIVRIYDEMTNKIYGTIRMGTVLGEKMSDKTAANIFITQGLKGEPITPYKHSMYRPMFYIDINDVCEGFKSFIMKILDDEMEERRDSSAHIFNLTYPRPITILDLANIVRDAIIKQSKGKIRPEIKIADKGLPSLYNVKNSNVTVNMEKAKSFFGLKKIASPGETIERIIAGRMFVHAK